MTSAEAKQDLEILLQMQMKLSLVGLEGLSGFPQEPPPIPELPEDYDFFAIQAKFAKTKFLVYE